MANPVTSLYPTVGVDASVGMLASARASFPLHDFVLDALPDLHVVNNDAFDNVLCSAVLMHLRREEIITAIMSIARILA